MARHERGGRCDFYYEVWGPHEGCAEFMEGPEAVVTCDKPSVYRAWITDPVTGERERLHACQAHVSEMRDAEVKMFRFRKV